MTKHPWTIRTQLLALVLVAITPLLLLIAFNILEHRERAREEVLRSTLAMTRLISARIDDHIHNIDTLLQQVAILTGTDLDAVDVNDHKLRALQGTLPGYFSSISVLAPDGRMLNSSTATRAEREKLSFADRDYFREAIAQRNLALGRPIVSRTSGKWILVAARPLFAADGSLRAVVSASTWLEHFQDLLAPPLLPTDSVMMVIDGNGIVVARSVEPLKWIGKDISASPHLQRARVEREYRDETIASDGVVRLAGYTTARVVPWVVYLGIPGTVALAQARTGLMRLSALALLVIVLAAVLAYLLARRITRPVEAIAQGAQQVAAGVMDARVDTRGANEIVNVAHHFNRMLDSLKRAEHKLRENEERLRIAMLTGHVGLQVWEHATGELYVSPEWKLLLGYEDHEIPNRRDAVQELIHPDDRSRVLTELDAYFSHLQPGHESEFRLRHRDGSYRWVLARVDPVQESGGQPPHSIACYVDITARKEQQESIARLNRVYAVLSGINSAIVRIHVREELFDEACHIAVTLGNFGLAWIGEFNPATLDITPVAAEGLGSDEMKQSPATARPDVSQGQGVLGRAVRERRPVFDNDISSQKGVGGRRRQEALRLGYRSLIVLPLFSEGVVAGILALFAKEPGFFTDEEISLLTELASNISLALQTIERREKLDYLSYYDALTGLPNRVLFIDRMGQQMRSRGGEPLMVALVLINVERFRNINESFGRDGGDELLRQIGRRLEGAFRGKDYLARTGADGFGVVMRGVRDAAAVVHAVENQILGCFRAPYDLAQSEVRVAARAGIAMFPADGSDADTLFRNAEAALKRAGASNERYLFYAADMNARAAQVLSLETRLRKAIDAQDFVLHYQPKIALARGNISGLEALIRWQDPESGLVSPATFIPLLEETGLILAVGRWAIAQALAQRREWAGRGCLVPRIAVNVSAIQLQQRDFADSVMREFQDGDSPQAIELEITESLLMKDIEGSIRKLAVLRQAGIHIAMDDFGTGYSSLSYIARLPIHSLKIDRAFTTGMSSSPQDMAIVTTIIALARSLNLKVVAEGVETETQARTLSMLGCDEAQGYFYSKPLPAHEMESLLQQGVKQAGIATAS